MQKPEKLLVNIDLSELDDNLMQYAAYLCEKLKIRKLVFLHNMLITEPPEELKSHYPELKEPLDTLVEREIHENIQRYLDPSAAEIEVSIFQNKGINEIVKWVSEQKVDLSLVGKKSPAEGQGWYARQYVRLTSHTVIMVPPMSSIPIKNILAPVDLSKNAINVIGKAHNMAMQLDADLSYLHLYSLPPQHFPYVTGNIKKYQEEYLRYAGREFEKWRKKSLGEEKSGPCHFHMAERTRVASEVYHWAENHQADLIICGDKDKLDVEIVLLGSVSEKLVIIDKQIPLMVLKRKENYGWLDSLLG